MTNQANQVVMITGASKGLGRALTLAFAKKSAKLILCARNEQQLNEVALEAKALGAEVLHIVANIANAKEVECLVGTAESHFGKIDVLINNASILGPSPMPYLLDYPEEDFTEVLQVNTVGMFLVTRRVIASMLLHNQGSIINLTSEAGNVGYAGWGAYGISKFAVEGLTQIWADEVSETAVRVNMVDPGEMNTSMHALAIPDCDYELAEPEDVVDVFLYLASNAASAVNGQRFRAQEFVKEYES
jgi:NAD(P)-dependent dehydrogenase (short-subunit alcohol dehydrogenase family)